MIRIVCALVASLLAVSCSSPTGPASSAPKTGLTITIADGVSRTLLPGLSMSPSSYTVTGNGPDSATFSQTLTGSSTTISSLALGSWAIVVEAFNSDGTSIGNGTATATVSTGANASVAVTVTPYTGLGTLSLSLSWTPSDVTNPSVSASLLPVSGSARPLTFSVNPSTGSSSFVANDVATGYQTLTLQLLDGTTVVSGTVEVVRIVRGQSTSGTFLFDKVNKLIPGGISATITPNMADPLTVLVSGAGSSMPQGSSMALGASVPGYSGNVVYVWYLNGAYAGTGATFTLGPSVAVGNYHVDVTAFSADGTRAGSQGNVIAVSNVEMLTDGAFSAGSAFWHPYAQNGATPTFSFAIGSFVLGGAPRGVNTWDIIMNQPIGLLKPYGLYRLTFDASSTVSNDMIQAQLQEGGTDINGDGKDYTAWVNDSFNLGTTKNSYSAILAMQNFTDPEAWFNFNFGATTGTITINNVSLQYVGTLSLPSGNQLLWNGDFKGGNAYWLWNGNGHTATPTYLNGSFTMPASQTDRGSNIWDTNFDQENLSFSTTKTYTISFIASSSVAGDQIQAFDADYNTGVYTSGDLQLVSLTTTPQTYTFNNWSPGINSTGTSRVGFGLGGTSGTIVITNVTFSQN